MRYGGRGGGSVWLRELKERIEKFAGDCGSGMALIHIAAVCRTLRTEETLLRPKNGSCFVLVVTLVYFQYVLVFAVFAGESYLGLR